VGQSLTQMGLQSVDQIAANLHLSNSQANAQNTEAKVKLAQIERKIAEDQLQSELLNHELAKLNRDKQTFDKVVHPMKRLLPDAVSQGYNFMAQKVPLPPFPYAGESESPLLQTEANKKACSCP
jgi:hypothetical protein